MVDPLFSRQIFSLTVKSLSVAVGTFLQILLFRNLSSDAFAFVLVVSILAAVIGQIDFGLIASVSIQLLNKSKVEKFDLISLSIVKIILIEFRQRIVSLFAIWVIFSSVTIFFLLAKIKDLGVSTLMLASVTLAAILFQGFSSLILRLLLTLGKSNRVLIAQLVGSLIQVVLFLKYPSIFTAVSTLIISPLIFILIAFWPNKFNPYEKFQMEEQFKEMHGINWNLQFTQILGAAVTLLIPYLSIYLLSSENAATFQLQYKIALVLIGVVSSTYINALRFSILHSRDQIKKIILNSTILSVVITSIAVLFLVKYWEALLQNSNSPNSHSWIGMSVFIVVQPLIQVLFFVVMGQEQYKTLIQSVMIQGVLLISSMVFFASLDPSLLMYALPLSTLISSIPILTRGIKSNS